MSKSRNWGGTRSGKFTGQTRDDVDRVKQCLSARMDAGDIIYARASQLADDIPGMSSRKVGMYLRELDSIENEFSISTWNPNSRPYQWRIERRD